MDNSIILLITKPLGEAVLDYFIDNQISISGIVTKQGGTGWWGKTNIEEKATEQGIPLYTHHNQLPDKNYDLGISVLYYNIIEKDFISRFDTMVNLHMGELPRYRGTNCTAHSIINARKDNYFFAGATLHILNHLMDAGDIIGINRIEIETHDTNRDVFSKVEKAAYDLFLKHIDDLLHRPEDLDKTPQREFIDQFSPCYTYYRNSLNKKMWKIEEIDNLLDLYDLARGMEFPPFEPLSINMNDHSYFVTIQTYGNEPKTSVNISRIQEITNHLTADTDNISFSFQDGLNLFFTKNIEEGSYKSSLYPSLL